MPVAAVAIAVAVGLAWPNTADRAYTRPTAVGEGSTAPPPLPAYVPLAGKRKTDAIATARTFIRTAVAREHVERSWQITHPLLRSGYTERDWATGDIPVVPYPVEVARWRLGSSTIEGVAFEVLLMPRAGSEVRPQVFDIELKELGSGPRKRWTVSSWSPRAAGIAQPAPSSPERQAAVARAVDERYGYTLGIAWLLAPAALLVGILLAIPIFLVTREWRRRRKGERLYRDHLSSRRYGRS